MAEPAAYVRLSLTTIVFILLTIADTSPRAARLRLAADRPAAL